MKKASYQSLGKLVLALSFVLAFPVSAAVLNQWQTLTPSGSLGYVFNTTVSAGNDILLGTDHGLFRSFDNGQNWTLANTGLSNLNVTAAAIGWHFDSATGKYIAASDSPVILGTSAGVFYGTVSGTNWAKAAGPTGRIYDLKFDQYSAAYLGAAGPAYAATDSGLWRSDDLGANWSLKNSGLSGVAVKKIVTDWANGLVYAISADNRIFSSPMASFSGVDESFSLIRPAGSETINDISVLNPVGGITWIATSGGILKGDYTGTIWEQKNSGLDGTNVSNVASDYVDSNISYAAIPGFGLYRTTNEASSDPNWLPINIGLPERTIFSVVTNPIDSQTLLVLGEGGLYQLTLTDLYADLTPPGTVNDLAIASMTDNSVTLKWTAPGNNGIYGQASSYLIKYSTSPITEANWANATEVAPEPTPKSAGSLETYTVFNLSPNTNYYFGLKAADGSYGLPLNFSALSNIVSTNPSDTQAPTVTAFTLPSTASSLSVPISSLAASDNIAVTGYFVSESSSVPSASASGWTASAPTSYTFTSAGSKTLYAFAKDAAGNVSAAKSATVTISLPDTQAPTVPAGLSALVFSPSQINLSWLASTDNVGVVGYKIYRDGIEIGTTTSNAYQNTGLNPATTYSYSVAAFDKAGNFSPKSASVSATTLSNLASLSITKLGSGSGSVLCDSSVCPATVVIGSQITFTAVAAAGSTFGFWGGACVGNSNTCTKIVSSNLTVTATFNLEADTQAPTVTAFTLPSTASSLSVPISSLAASDNIAVTGYFVSESSSVPSASASGWTASAPTSYTFTSAGSKTLYAFAKDAAGNVSAAKSAAVTISLPDTQAPDVPTGLTARAVSSSEIELVWNASQDNIGAAGYRVFRDDIYVATSLTTFFRDTGLSSGTLYSYAVSAFDSTGNTSAHSLPVSVATPGISVTLTISNLGSGAGTVLCDGSSCPSTVTSGTMISLTASPEQGSLFAGWGGACQGSIKVCSLTLSSNTSVSAAFNLADNSAPSITSFQVPTNSDSLRVPITLSASDDTGVTGYYISESGSIPALSAIGWIYPAPSSYTFATPGSKVLYAFAKDAAGNISPAASAQVAIVIADTSAPVVSSFCIVSRSDSWTVPVTCLRASDDSAVTGYYISESPVKPSANASGWRTAVPASYSFTVPMSVPNGGITKSLYAFAKDASGNVSNPVSDSVIIKIKKNSRTPASLSPNQVSAIKPIKSSRIAPASYLYTSTITQRNSWFDFLKRNSGFRNAAD